VGYCRTAQSADPFGFVCVLLHLDMERILSALDSSAVKYKHDRATGPRNKSGTIWSYITAQSASGLLGILPCFIFFLIFQRTLTKGITAGGHQVDRRND